MLSEAMREAATRLGVWQSIKAAVQGGYAGGSETGGCGTGKRLDGGCGAWLSA